MTPQIYLKKVSKYYMDGIHKRKIIENATLTVHKGDFLSIVGESGSGKSTLLNILSLLDNKFDGDYFIGNTDVRKLNDYQLSQKRRNMIGFVFQDFLLLPNLTVIENILLQKEYLTDKQINKISNEYIEYLITKTGLKNLINRYPSQLSGGQKQRVAISRALINNPDIIVADEPTGSLDTETGKSIISLLKQFNKEGKTIIMVTHDQDVANMADYKIGIQNREVYEV
ncbi:MULTISPECIES: ABC transporter ATP-binding protein [Leuconostoc]|uniref:ABC transporter ATP-binding protein n=1 Tax=Leuconostoc TaxID=1243 RepID=UPI0032DF8F6F